MSDSNAPDVDAVVVDTVRTVIREARPRLIASALSGSYGEKHNERHEDNFLSSHDLWMHERYKTLLRKRIPAFVYASEEGDPEIIGHDPDLIVLVDPLDTSELAVRGILGYTHVMVYSRSLARPIAAVVGDLYHHIQLYIAARGADGKDRAYVATEDGEPRPIGVTRRVELSEALVTNYLMRPAERLMPLARQTRLLEALSGPDGKGRGRIGVDFGSVSLCHVATGVTDATVEFAKGFAIWDLAPGHYILRSAGGAVIDLDGNPLPLDQHWTSMADIASAMDRRQKFIAASTPELAHSILAVLDATQ
jgi:myo-inositol-1(or 4)-monophosphatase